MTDNVDLSHVRWVAGKYDERQIENLFVFERAVAVKRVGNVIMAIERYCLERSDIIGIGNTKREKLVCGGMAGELRSLSRHLSRMNVR